MKKQRPTYSAEFKKESAELVTNKGYSVQDAAVAVGVGPTELRRWVNQLQGESAGQAPSAKAMTPGLSHIISCYFNHFHIKIDK